MCQATVLLADDGSDVATEQALVASSAFDLMMMAVVLMRIAAVDVPQLARGAWNIAGEALEGTGASRLQSSAPLIELLLDAREDVGSFVAKEKPDVTVFFGFADDNDRRSFGSETTLLNVEDFCIASDSATAVLQVLVGEVEDDPDQLESPAASPAGIDRMLDLKRLYCAYHATSRAEEKCLCCNHAEQEPSSSS